MIVRLRIPLADLGFDWDQGDAPGEEPLG
jgi:hypothetical protein